MTMSSLGRGLSLTLTEAAPTSFHDLEHDLKLNITILQVCTSQTVHNSTLN